MVVRTTGFQYDALGALMGSLLSATSAMTELAPNCRLSTHVHIVPTRNPGEQSNASAAETYRRIVDGLTSSPIFAPRPKVAFFAQ